MHGGKTNQELQIGMHNGRQGGCWQTWLVVEMNIDANLIRAFLLHFSLYGVITKVICVIGTILVGK